MREEFGIMSMQSHAEFPQDHLKMSNSMEIGFGVLEKSGKQIRKIKLLTFKTSIV